MTFAANTSESQELPAVRVLVVDDNDDVANCLVELLRRFGYVARACYSGPECLDCLHEFEPQVILLDFNMPFLDGAATCRLIRQTAGFEQLPIVACSALDPDMLAERGETDLFSHYLVKPVTSAKLLAAIDRVLNERSEQANSLTSAGDIATLQAAN